MVKVLTKYDIDEILAYPKDYINEKEEIDLLQVGDNILKLGCWSHPYYYLLVDSQSEFSLYAPDIGESLADLYSKVVCKLNDSVDVSKMSHSEFIEYLCNDFVGRFSLILDYDELDYDNFSVYKDMATGKFYYLDASEFSRFILSQF